MLAVLENAFVLCCGLTMVGTIGLGFATFISYGPPSTNWNLEIPYGSLVSLAETTLGLALSFVLLDVAGALLAIVAGIAIAALLTRLLGWGVQAVWLVGQACLLALAGDGVFRAVLSMV